TTISKSFFEPRLWAIGSGVYLVFLRIFLTFCSASAETLPRLCSTRSTVPTETPAISAMSLIRILLFLSMLYQSDNLIIIFNLMSRHSLIFDLQVYVKWEILANRPSDIIVNHYDIICYRIINHII